MASAERMSDYTRFAILLISGGHAKSISHKSLPAARGEEFRKTDLDDLERLMLSAVHESNSLEEYLHYLTCGQLIENPSVRNSFYDHELSTVSLLQLVRNNIELYLAMKSGFHSPAPARPTYAHY